MLLKNTLPEFYKKYQAKPGETLYEHTASVLKNLEKLKLIAKIPYVDLIVICCIYHDVGKTNPLFQERLLASVYFDATKEVGHNILSAYLLKELISKDEIDSLGRENFIVILYAIVNHHHYIDNLSYLEEKKELIKENLQRIDRELFEGSNHDRELFKNLGRAEKEDLMNIRENPSNKAILVKGFLHKCDYAASAHGEIEIPNYDLDDRLKHFPYEWNAMQLFAKEKTDSNLILIGSTGLGKTEASLLWLGNHKGFYVLPLKTAINAMYKRIHKEFYLQDFTRNLGLLHGEMKNIYLNELEKDSLNAEEEFWQYYELTKSMAMPLTIATPDQIFLFAFKYPGYELPLATYSYSKIIIDEIQAYSPDVLATLIYGLQWINSVGGKFAITTATMPPFIKDLLVNSRGDVENTGEPVTCEEGTFLNKRIRHKVELKDCELEVNDIVNFVKEKIDDASMKVLVVVNTVSKAQELYCKLREQLALTSAYGLELYLLHSKFMVKDRHAKETKILNDGKTSCKKKVIWVTTQVIEASLDIDFDYLFTELSDLSGLLQRMGRCNRKGVKNIKKSNVFVYTKLSTRLFRRIKGKNAYAQKGFIYQSLLELSKAALYEWQQKNIGNEMSESDKNMMINNWFTMDKLREYEDIYCDSSYLSDYWNAYEHLEHISAYATSLAETKMEFRNILSVKAIPKCLYENLKGIKTLIMEVKEKKREMYRADNITIKNEIKTKILRLKNGINQFTIMVDFSNSNSLKEKLNIDGEIVYLTHDNYDKELGLLRSKKANSELIRS